VRTSLKLVLFGAFLVVAGFVSRPVVAEAFPSFSLTPASPGSGALGAGSILDPATGAPTAGGPQGAPVVAFTAASLGLPPAANIDGL
jgi:hypothetical protein